jgi:hypothetical protein
MEHSNYVRPPNGIATKVIRMTTSIGVIDKHKARCATTGHWPAFLVNAKDRSRGNFWPSLPLQQLHNAAGRELLLANFNAYKHILALLDRAEYQDVVVIVDVGYSDMLVLDITAPRPPGFELFHVVRLITRQDAAGTAGMLGMPSLCIEHHNGMSCRPPSRSGGHYTRCRRRMPDRAPIGEVMMCHIIAEAGPCDLLPAPGCGRRLEG